jgi:hypothetical protein
MPSTCPDLVQKLRFVEGVDTTRQVRCRLVFGKGEKYNPPGESHTAQ